ncbi:alkaline phosphatase [Roseibium sp. SCP14]|uniref:alkaline phosphatase n=1 Tax=Roseibium sp. SCP14 TaxID=3141375 RepID=UPI003334BF0E
MKTIVSSALALTLTGTVAFAQDALPQQDNDWFTAAQAEHQQGEKRDHPDLGRERRRHQLCNTPVSRPAKQRVRRREVLPHEAFPHLALSKIYNVNAQAPVSAGTGTAMHSGIKTNQGGEKPAAGAERSGTAPQRLKRAFEKGDAFEIEMEFDFGHIEMHTRVEGANATRHSHAGHALL